MAMFRIDLIYNMGRFGWSEVYWRDAASVDTAGQIAFNLAGHRTKLLNRNARVDGFRLTQYSSAGLVTNRGLTQSLLGDKILGNQPAGRDQQDVAMLIKFAGEGKDKRKNMWLRGMPDSSVEYDENGNPLFGGGWNAVWEPYRKYMTEGQFYIRTFNTSPTNPPVTIRSIEFKEDWSMVLNLTAPLSNAAPGKRLKVFGYRGKFSTCVNGMAQIRAIDEALNAYTLDKESCKWKAQLDTANGATVRLENYEFTPIRHADDERPSRRKVGRAFFVDPGRRKGRKGCRITRVERS